MDLTLTLLSHPGFSLKDGNFSLNGDLVLLLLVEAGDLNLSQKLIELSTLLLKVSITPELDLDLINGEVIEEEEYITEDCLENCPRQVLAASSKAEVEDVLDNLASVSTYMTASTWREKNMAWFAVTGDNPCLARDARMIRSILRSA